MSPILKLRHSCDVVRAAGLSHSESVTMLPWLQTLKSIHVMNKLHLTVTFSQVADAQRQSETQIDGIYGVNYGVQWCKYTGHKKALWVRVRRTGGLAGRCCVGNGRTQAKSQPSEKRLNVLRARPHCGFVGLVLRLVCALCDESRQSLRAPFAGPGAGRLH